MSVSARLHQALSAIRKPASPPVSLTPRVLHDVSAGQHERYHWQVSGSRPTFALDLASPDPLETIEGWHRLRGNYQADDPRRTAPVLRTLHPIGATSRALQVQDGTTSIDKIFHILRGTTGIELNIPVTTNGFDLDQLTLTPIGQAEAAARMATRVVGGLREEPEARATLLSRTVQAARKGGTGALRELLVADYEGFQHRQSGPLTIDYESWVKWHDTLGDDDRHAVEAAVAQLVDPPTISLLMPTYNTDERWLRKAIESVQAQWYPHWQLCIADDASPEPHVRRILDDYAAADERISVVLREHNGHISAASNSALELATGTYVGLIDHDDELRPHALYLMAQAILDAAAAGTPADLVYSDEDKIDHDGNRTDPHFKPPFNHDLLLAQNYISHFTVLRSDLVREVGGFREGFEGSQDYDLFLRCVAESDADRIVHVPFVTYHWRAIAGSTASSTNAKDYTEDAALAALADHVAAATVEVAKAPTTYRVRWPDPEPAPLVSIVIPTRDGADLVGQCIDSLTDPSRTAYRNIEIIVVDNQSAAPDALALFAELESSGRARVVSYDDEFNYSAINNFGVAESAGELVCLLNNDIEAINPDWLGEMVRQVTRPGVGAVGAKLLYPDDTIQHAGVVLGLGGVAGHGHKRFDANAFGYFSRLGLVHEVGAVTAAALLTTREVWDHVGGLDAENLAVAFNDIDLCLRIRAAGYNVIFTPYAELYHYESVSRGGEDTPEKQQRFAAEVHHMLDTWEHELLADPAYSPNLSLEVESFAPARVPRAAYAWRPGGGSLRPGSLPTIPGIDRPEIP